MYLGISLFLRFFFDFFLQAQRIFLFLEEKKYVYLFYYSIERIQIRNTDEIQETTQDVKVSFIKNVIRASLYRRYSE